MIDRISRAAPRLIRLIAPAGYGKTTLVHQLGSGYARFAVCDCDGAQTLIELSRRIISASSFGLTERADSLARQMVSLKADEPSHWRDLALRAWTADDPVDELFVFDNLEALYDATDLQDLIARLLAENPACRTVAFCSRVPVTVRVPRHLQPHLTLTIGVDDLAFDHNEFLAAFERIQVQREVLNQIEQMTRGWPLAVRLFRRLVIESGSSAVPLEPDAIAFADLYDYLRDHVLGLMGPHHITALLACTAIPDATELDIASAFHDDTNVRETLTEVLPFLARTGKDSFAPHPLISQTLRERFPSRCKAILKTVADAHDHAGNWLQAARLYLAGGDIERAAEALNAHDTFVVPTWPLKFAEIVTQIPEEIAIRYPALYSATSILRVPQLTPEEWAVKTSVVWEALPADTLPHTRASAFGAYAAALMNLGKLDQANELLRAYEASRRPDDFAGAMCAALIGTGIATWRGRFSGLEQSRTEMSPVISASAGWHAQFLYEFDARQYRCNGDWGAERRTLEHALDFARKSNMPTIPLWVLTYQAFGAWLAGDDRYYEARLAELEAEIYEGAAKGFSFFVDCARGRAESTSSGYERPEIRSYALLIAAAVASTEAERRRWAVQALSAAESSGQPFAHILARVALAELDIAVREENYESAVSLADAVESEPLREALSALRNQSARGNMLKAFARRFQQFEPRAREPLAIQLMQGRVCRGGVALDLMKREFELLCVLALKKKPMSTDDLLELVWPNQSGSSSVVRVYAARLRTRLGSDVVIRARDGYSIAIPVLVDLLETEARCRSLDLESPDPATIPSIKSLFDALCVSAPSWLVKREWFAPYVPRIEELRRKLGLTIARYCHANGDERGALSAVAELTALDPCDERARELAIKVYLGTGDQLNAKREYRLYREALEKSLGAEPPRWLAELVSAT
ncbi:MAG: winged helix-turn-helix domain-containing protein [Candidatus Eremiobacteraeota bacterium]|nr:winged helix-turn-helix domain-containing protein [Candidatus Eremiobacteraeota bacterium]